MSYDLNVDQTPDPIESIVINNQLKLKGIVTEAKISPDGKYVGVIAYNTNADGTKVTHLILLEKHYDEYVSVLNDNVSSDKLTPIKLFMLPKGVFVIYVDESYHDVYRFVPYDNTTTVNNARLPEYDRTSDYQFGSCYNYNSNILAILSTNRGDIYSVKLSIYDISDPLKPVLIKDHVEKFEANYNLDRLSLDIINGDKSTIVYLLNNNLECYEYTIEHNTELPNSDSCFICSLPNRSISDGVYNGVITDNNGAVLGNVYVTETIVLLVHSRIGVNRVRNLRFINKKLPSLFNDSKMFKHTMAEHTVHKRSNVDMATYTGEILLTDLAVSVDGDYVSSISILDPLLIKADKE